MSERRPPPHPGLVACAVLGGLILAVFGPTLQYELLEFDSAKYVVADHAVHTLAWENIVHIFTTPYFVNFIPFSRFSYLLDHALWGLEPAGFRGTNILLHWIAAVFVFLFVLELTGRRFPAWLATIIFAVHPSRVESVVWIAGRKDVLAAAFGFFAVWAWGKSSGWWSVAGGQAEKIWNKGQVTAPTNHRPPTTIHYLASLLAYVCALASKPQWIPLCAVLPVIDLYRGLALTRRRLLGYVPFFAVSLASVGVTMWAQFDGGARNLAVPLSTRLLLPFRDVAFYLGHALWPVRLSPRYSEVKPYLIETLVGLAAVMLLGVAAYRSFRGRRELFLGLAWFALFLLPILEIVPVKGLVPADRYLYVSIVGLSLPVGLWLDRRSPRIGWTVGIVLLLALSALTRRYEPVWKNDVALWKHAVAYNPDNAFALSSLVQAQARAGNFAEARRAYQRALGLPRHFVLLFQAGSELAEQTNADPGEPLRTGLEKYPNSIDLMGQYGHVLMKQGNYTEAELWLTRSFDRGQTVEVAADLAKLFRATSRPAQGLAAAVIALNGDPFNPEYWFLLGTLQEQGGQTDAAGDAYRVAARLDAAYPAPRVALARLAGNRGEWNTAVAELESLRATVAPPVGADDLLADGYARLGRLSDARAARALAVQRSERRNPMQAVPH